ncbi:MAG TPA: tRNA (adenosine(37)-N6)-threonylcarbamoyltransferase complex transferase subunit TsaD [Dehalococcoidia bacterium]|nr:tRNA (adenosine(37)-N6)-threonylcarbamoyltransferase complex transferase subunit TsaD [Chloroflexota bacterium]HCE77320.1 tRNA (adenosine(37)-N6)-threonylcarbamoyltransferase complex transferase subunit TsaD [Dehalococcoidia bacterium]
MNVLGIETSCDDTAAAVITDGTIIKSNIVASQSDMHKKYGGIIPEIASREHFTSLIPVVNEALEQASLTYKNIDAIAVTNGPGLAGSLLIGVNSAKGLSMSWDKPLIGINHLEGHIYSAWLEDLEPDHQAGFPLVCLIASGGHTDLVVMKDHLDYKLIGKTRDDAAGEAFDKAARVLGLGFPGGPEIQKMSEEALETVAALPRPAIKDSLDFSFSGLKTALVRKAEAEGFYPVIDNNGPSRQQTTEYSFAFQEAIVDCLVRNTVKAVSENNAKGVILGGGVAANSRLRQKMNDAMDVPVFVPRPGLCTDNGAMIGAAAFFNLQNGLPFELDMDAIPNLRMGIT